MLMLNINNDENISISDIKKCIEKENIHLIRLAWADTHGCARAKQVTPNVFFEALSQGYNINVATSTLDAAGGRIFSSFTPGGGLDNERMTGSPNLIIKPILNTFRLLPWAPGVAWVLCDEYFCDGTAFTYSSRQVLRKQLERLQQNNMELVIGLEIEFYINRLQQAYITQDNIGQPGIRGKPISTIPIEPGFSLHCESGLDLLQPILSELALMYAQSGLPLRSMESEFGPSQVECTFAKQDALQAADNLVFFRTATKQICRRNGYHASFMCLPALKGCYPSGWHLHMSLIDAQSKQNLMLPESENDPLSPAGQNFLAGLLEHGLDACIFTTPTINGYKRFRPNSLAPDRVAWAHDHRGAMLRLIGGVGDAATRIENRVGEPGANPYLFIASQIAAGLDGIKRQLDPGQGEDAPYSAERPKLPHSLAKALQHLGRSELYRGAFGAEFIDYFIQFKQAEIKRFEKFCTQNSIEDTPEQITAWEQNEYFDFF